MCKVCGRPLIMIENKKYNDFYLQKIDTFNCEYCGRTIEEARKLEGLVK
jgi:hypothetical protein